MKRHIINICIGLLLILFPGLTVNKANAQDAAKSPLVISIAYSTSDNTIPYLTIKAKSKISGKFQPIGGAEIKLFLDKDSTGKGLGLIGKVITDEKGKAVSNIPSTVETLWKANPNHTFLALYEKTKNFDEANAELSVVKSKITLDTADDKNVTATFTEFKGGAWVPVKGVEMKLGVKRLAGDLQIGEEQSYTTDSLGKVKGEFKKLGIPGNRDGNIVLVAKVEDNDTYGNLRIEKSVPWGSRFVADNSFFHRALWASQFHSPVWLVFLAYSILISVWGTLIYLVFLLIKVKQLGKEEERLK